MPHEPYVKEKLCTWTLFFPVHAIRFFMRPTRKRKKKNGAWPFFLTHCLLYVTGSYPPKSFDTDSKRRISLNVI